MRLMSFFSDFRGYDSSSYDVQIINVFLLDYNFDFKIFITTSTMKIREKAESRNDGCV